MSENSIFAFKILLKQQKLSNRAFLRAKERFSIRILPFFDIKAKSLTRIIKNQYLLKVQCQSQLI